MDIRHLKYFVTVAQQGSFTKAAETLHVTQPTLSKMVRLLEQELDVVLFDRSSKHIQLTDAGQTILRSAQRILNSMDSMTAELDDLLQLRKGKLLLGLPPMIGGQFFPHIIEKFHSLYPNIEIKLFEQGGKKIEGNIEEGKLDVGIVIMPVENEELFSIHPFLEDHLKVVVHSQHMLADRKTVELSELSAEPFILFREEFTSHHLIKQACKTVGFEPNIVFESSQWDFMIGMVGAKFGVTFLPARVCETLDRERFRTIELREPVIPWNLSMIWSKDKYLTYATRAWIQFVSKLQEKK